MLATVGCGDFSDFPAHELVQAEEQLVPTHRQQVAAILNEVFGAPSEPIVPDGLADLLDLRLLQQAAGRVASNEPGQTLGLYRRHCAVCHGLSGDGQGPAALYEAPYPRDFRAGVFKFKSTYRGAKPTGADLAATLRFGLPGTAMPSFALLPVEEIESLVEYVRYLAIRGELEQALARYVGEELDFDPATGEVDDESRLDWRDTETRELVLDELLPPIARGWREAESSVVAAAAPVGAGERFSAAEVTAGRALFHDAQRANCAKCHGEDGAGGANLVDYNDWNKRVHEYLEETKRRVASRQTLEERVAEAAPDRHEFLVRELATRYAEIDARRAAGDVLLPPRIADPRTLVPGSLRGARSREHLYRVISQGIAGTPMPAVGPTDPGGVGALNEDEIWRLVAYVESLTDQPDGGRHD
ncbi:Cytochrome c [Posidoniimonas polymericola]|uniref:Cytochrome c n=1 Tax=Posidoniimonas polymericola TaxID=2528002 RepID=A0A5C5YRQ5_9BACT|nr:c-type cytochrome [Posidoniimonas polymericola]TWT77513.1 Cytochrome c [Posidoniimonas polymericola]